MIYKFKKLFLAIILGWAFFISTCSANELQTIPESRQGQFEQAFAEQCVNKEIRNSVNKEEDRRRFSAPCACIAKRMSTDLSVPDIEKFLQEKKSTHALNMSFDEAAFFCVQQKKTPKPPALFGRK